MQKQNCFPNKQKCLYCIWCETIIRHLNLSAFKMFIFCMMSVPNAREVVKITICRDCLLQDSSSLAFSGITTPTHSKHNSSYYLIYRLYCRYHLLLWINNASCISLSNFILAPTGWCSVAEDTLQCLWESWSGFHTVEGEDIYFIKVN